VAFLGIVLNASQPNIPATTLLPTGHTINHHNNEIHFHYPKYVMHYIRWAFLPKIVANMDARNPLGISKETLKLLDKISPSVTHQ
jgi:hypothetical protein